MGWKSSALTVILLLRYQRTTDFLSAWTCFFVPFSDLSYFETLFFRDSRWHELFVEGHRWAQGHPPVCIPSPRTRSRHCHYWLPLRHHGETFSASSPSLFIIIDAPLAHWRTKAFPSAFHFSLSDASGLHLALGSHWIISFRPVACAIWNLFTLLDNFSLNIS